MYGQPCELSANEFAFSNDVEGLGSDSSWFDSDEHRPKASPQPSRSYALRSSHLARLRAQIEWAQTNSDDEIQPPSDAARHCAKAFIENLPHSCVDFRLAISHNGEINFFFGDGAGMLQILIDDSGHLSFYGETNEEFSGSGYRAEEFPYMQLVKFLG